MAEKISAQYPEAVIEGFEIQSMVGGGTEMILGMTVDQTFGPVCCWGWAACLPRSSTTAVLAFPPIGEDEALELIHSLRGAPILKGARGRAPADVEALAKAISGFSRLAIEEHQRLQEIDLNPIMVLPKGQGAMAVDALVIACKPQ